MYRQLLINSLPTYCTRAQHFRDKRTAGGGRAVFSPRAAVYSLSLSFFFGLAAAEAAEAAEAGVVDGVCIGTETQKDG